MAIYTYSAQDSDGKLVSGNVEATSRENALTAITKQNLKPIEISEQKNLIAWKFGGKVKSRDMVIFTRQLSTMVSAGVPLLRSLSTLAKQTNSDALKQALEQVSKDIQGGTPLGEAFGRHPKVFNEIYVNMVRAGESGGILDQILLNLAAQQEKNDSMHKKIKGAMAYPMVLLFITIVAFFGLMIFVIPMIGKILRDLGGPDAKLPELTLAMLAISNFIITKWYILAIIIAAGVFATRKYLSSPNGRSKFHHILIKVPGVGSIITKIAVARFARIFSALIGAGVSVVEALHVTANAIGNDAYKEALLSSINDIEAGQLLSSSLSRGKLFPEIVPQMLSVGEETGQTDTILLKVADFYEEEVATAINSISSIIEPVMITIMGSMVGLIAASVMGPIASLSQNIKG